MGCLSFTYHIKTCYENSGNATNYHCKSNHMRKLYIAWKEAEKVKNHIFNDDKTISSFSFTASYQSHHTLTKAWHLKWFYISHARGTCCVLRIKSYSKVDWQKLSRPALWRSRYADYVLLHNTIDLHAQNYMLKNKVCNYDSPNGQKQVPCKIMFYEIVAVVFPMPYKGIRIPLWQHMKTVFYGLVICLCLLGLNFLVAFSQLKKSVTMHTVWCHN